MQVVDVRAVVRAVDSAGESVPLLAEVVALLQSHHRAQQLVQDGVAVLVSLLLAVLERDAIQVVISERPMVAGLASQGSSCPFERHRTLRLFLR